MLWSALKAFWSVLVHFWLPCFKMLWCALNAVLTALKVMLWCASIKLTYRTGCPPSSSGWGHVWGNIRVWVLLPVSKIRHSHRKEPDRLSPPCNKCFKVLEKFGALKYCENKKCLEVLGKMSKVLDKRVEILGKLDKCEVMLRCSVSRIEDALKC